MRRSAVPVLTAVLSLLLVSVAPASAGPPGSWTVLTAGQTNISEPGLLRTGDGVLHVLWQRDDGSTDSLWHGRIGANGQVVDTTAVVTGWDSIQNTPRLVPTVGGGLRAVFAGIMDSSPPSGFHDAGRIYTAVSDAAGTFWTLPAEALSKDEFAIDSQVGGAMLGDGTPVTAWADDGGFRWHIGTETDPDSSTDGDATTGKCCSYGVSVAADGDEAWAAYYSNADGARGIWVRRFAPTLGPAVKAPYSTKFYEGQHQSVSQDSTQAFATRVGGDVFLAYLVGYPTANHVELWNVSTDKAVAVPGSDDATDVALGRDPDGRIWVAWLDDEERVHAVRTGADGSGFGGVRTLKGPADSLYDVFVDGSADKADLFVNTGTKLRHQQVWPGLNADANPTAWSRGHARKVTFTVRDAGVPLSGAEVSALDKGCTTGPDGRCSINFPAMQPKSFVATVTHDGYGKAKIPLRVRR